MLNPLDARRRWFGAFFLIIAGLLLVWGLTLLQNFLFKHPILFVFYWLLCLGFTFLSFLTAALDMVVMRKRIKKEHEKLIQKNFSDVVAREPGKKHKTPEQKLK